MPGRNISTCICQRERERKSESHGGIYTSRCLSLRERERKSWRNIYMVPVHLDVSERERERKRG